MIDDPVGCLTGEPMLEGLERELWEQEQLRKLQQYEDWLVSPF